MEQRERMLTEVGIDLPPSYWGDNANYDSTEDIAGQMLSVWLPKLSFDETLS